jgi:hypothetical protein
MGGDDGGPRVNGKINRAWTRIRSQFTITTGKNSRKVATAQGKVEGLCEQSEGSFC